MWFLCSGNLWLGMAYTEMLVDLMSHSQELANMTKRLEDKTLATE